MKKAFLFIAALAMSFMAAQAADWSTAYSSNVELSTEGGTSASAAKVVIGGTEYDAIKAGTSSAKGACVVTIPAATKTLHFHAAGWNKEKVTLDVNGTEFTLVADAGVSGSSPFTLANDPATEDYFTFDPQGATTITIAASETTAGKRFVLFGVNADDGDTPTPPAKELVSLEIGGAASVLAYNVGEAFNPAGLIVTGTYDDASTADVTSNVNWTITPETFAEASESTSVEVIAKIGSIESAPFQVSGIVVTAKPDPVGGNTIVFEDYEVVSFTTSDGAYTVLAERGGGSNDPAYNATGKDLRNYAKGTFTLTSNNGNMTKIVFNISAQGLKRQAEITPSAGAMAYDMDNKVVTWTGDAAEVVFTVGEKAVYGSDDDSKAGQFDFVSIEITLGDTPTPQKEVVDVRVTDEPTKMEYFVGESFDPAGLTVTAIYDDASTEDVTSKATWTIEPATFTEASESASVSVKAEFNKVKSKPRTITGIVVTAKVVPTGYASVYTSNVELTAGDNSSDAVIKYDGGEYNGVKCGTSSKAGSCTTTIPAATKMLHFHAIGWKGAAATTLTVNGTEYTITPDDGITGNSPFTLVGDAYEYYYTFDPQGATEITFTSDKRFVVFGVNAELQEGVVAAPTFTPAETNFDQEVTVTLASETEGVNIFYTLDGSSPIDNPEDRYYSKPFKLTKTTTIKAFAIDQEGKRSAVSEKTYTLVPAYTVEEIAAITPTGQTFVLVLKEDEIVEIKAGDKGDVSGIYFQATAKKIELYQQNYAFPKTWEVGGKVSGRVMGEWTDFNGTWELKIAQDEVAKLSYTAPGPVTGIREAMINANVRKAMVNGRLIIVKGEKAFDLQGRIVK